jgi:hypothetical protein
MPGAPPLLYLCTCFKHNYYSLNIYQTPYQGGVMVNVFALCTLDRGFKPQSGQTKDY